MNIFIAIIAFGLSAFLALGVLGGPLLIGKPRQPWTAGQVAFNSITGAVIIALLIYAGVQLLSGGSA